MKPLIVPYLQVIHAEVHHYSDYDNNIAVKSRPAHEIQDWYKSKERQLGNKTKVGRNKTQMKKSARYVNWITPFCWNQIQLAGRKTKSIGGLSPSGIVKWLHRFDNLTFSRLSKSTVAEWIEKRNGIRVWKESILSRAKHGNMPGHDKGGCRGILVSGPTSNTADIDTHVGTLSKTCGGDPESSCYAS